MKQTLRIITAAALATTALIKGVPALAEPVQVPNISIVQTADLNLSTAAGRERLDHRLVTAAREVCGTPSDSDLVGKNQARVCRSNVLTKARAESQQLASRGSGEVLIAASR